MRRLFWFLALLLLALWAFRNPPRDRYGFIYKDGVFYVLDSANGEIYVLTQEQAGAPGGPLEKVGVWF